MASSNALFAYRPDRGQYQRKDERFILGKIAAAKQMAAGVRQIGEQAKEVNQISADSIDHMVNIFTAKHEIGLPESKRYVSFDAKSAKATDVIFRVMGMLLANERSQYVYPQGKPRDDMVADEIEAHINAFPQWHHRKYKTRYDAQSLFWQLLAGKSWIQQSYLEFYWDKNTLGRRGEGKSKEKDADFNARIAGYKGYMGPPVFRESIDPRMVFPIKTKMGTQAVVKNYRVQRFDIEDAMSRVGKAIKWTNRGDVEAVIDMPAGQMLPVQSDAPGANDAIDYWEYIDEACVYYVVGDKLCYDYEHNGGIRILEGTGLLTGFEEYHLSSVGILWAVRNEIPQLDFMRTLWMQKAYLDVFPQLVAQLGERDNPIVDEAGNARSWDITPGTIVQVRGALVNALKDAASGVDFRAALQMFNDDIDLATIPQLARGVAGMQQPGYAINQLHQSMRTLWKSIIESREQQISDLNEHYLWTVKHVIDSDVSMFSEMEDPETGRRTGKWFVLKRDSIHDYFQVHTQLKPELPIDRQGMMIAGAKLLEGNHITHEEYTRDFMDKTNPVERRRQLDRDFVRQLMLPKAAEDAMALGRVKVTTELLESRGLDDLNPLFAMDIQALKEARSQQNATQDGAAGAGVNGTGPTGSHPAPTAGVNPANATPGPRQGDPASGLRES